MVTGNSNNRALPVGCKLPHYLVKQLGGIIRWVIGIKKVASYHYHIYFMGIGKLRNLFQNFVLLCHPAKTLKLFAQVPVGSM